MTRTSKLQNLDSREGVVDSKAGKQARGRLCFHPCKDTIYVHCVRNVHLVLYTSSQR